MRTLGYVSAVFVCLAAVSCGGGSSGSGVHVSVTVSGLAGNALVLQDNGGDDLAVTSDGTYQFAKGLASGDAYAVTVKVQPQAPAQTCVVNGGTGTIGKDPVEVAVSCGTATFAVGGTVTGLTGTGLVLQDNGGDDLPIAADGTFTFATPVASGAAYAVTVRTAPSGPTQVCTVSNGNGTIGTAAVTNVMVTCSVDHYVVAGTITGLQGTVVIQNDGADDLALTSDGAFVFPTPVASGAPYTVTVSAQPTMPSQTCVVAMGSGTVTNANITNVAITCTTNHYFIGGTVTGLAGSGLVLQDNSGDDLAIAADGSFQFATPVLSGQTYDVTVSAQPSGPTQTCVVVGGTGTVGGADVTSVAVNCTTNKYTIGGTLSGLSGATGLVIENNLGDDLMLTADGTFAFATPIDSGTMYSVTVKTQPTSPWETCTVTNATGTVTNANITNVHVTCTPDKYSVSVMVSGLAGSGLVMQDNGTDNLSITGNGTFTFATQVASGSMYDVTVKTPPTGPWQTCAVASPTGMITNMAVTVSVTCTTNSYTIGGTVTSLGGTGLVLQDNGGDDLPIAADGSFTFATSLLSGATYSVTVKTQPATGNACNVYFGNGTVMGTNVTTVRVSCSPQTCGNGVVEGAEQCDDGNAVDTDACSNSCTYGPITIGGNGASYVGSALTTLGETFTSGTTYPPAGNGVIIMGLDGGSGPFPDYTAMLNAGGHVLLIGGSNLGTGAGSYTAYVNTYVTTDNTSNWHTSGDCTGDFNAVGTHPITQFLPATYEFTNESISYHMLHLSATQPTGATLIGQTCSSAAHNPPGVLVTRVYPSGGTLTVMALDIGYYTDANAPAQFVEPFLKGYLAYIRGPH